MTILKAARVLRGISIDALGEQLGGIRKASLSVSERMPNRTSKRVKRLLERHYGVPFEGLATEIDTTLIAQSLLDAVRAKCPKTKTTHNRKKAA